MATTAKTKTPTKKSPTKKSVKKVVPKTSTTKKAVKASAPKKTTKLIQEENSYKNTFIAALIIALIFLFGIFMINTLGKDKPEAYVATEDETKFKAEYENLNGEENSSVTIIEDNNIVYIDMKKAAEILDSKSGVIYFGYASDELARNAVPVLLDAMSETKLDTIYYVNLKSENKDLRDLYSLTPKNKAKLETPATEEYELVRTALANHLEDYVLYTNKGKAVNTGKKRLESPTVVSVVEGQVLGFHTGTVDNHDETKELTTEQQKELKAAYGKVISSQLNKKCTIEKGC